jgi:hypothetical protein
MRWLSLSKPIAHSLALRQAQGTLHYNTGSLVSFLAAHSPNKTKEQFGALIGGL